MASPAMILSIFFEEQLTQNHPQYLSWLSRAHFSGNLSWNSYIKRGLFILSAWVIKPRQVGPGYASE